MISVKEIIIVEGAYDKIKLSSFIEGIIFVTGGFSLLKNSEKLEGLHNMVQQRGAVILTDSDSAGIRIRNLLKQHLPSDKLKHAYIPEIVGKEKRKRKPGAEELIGVEGMDEDIILQALTDAGCSINGDTCTTTGDKITKQLLYSLGISGREDSKSLRKAVSKHLGIPEKLSSNMLCEYLSGLFTVEELTDLIDQIKNSSHM